MFTKGTKVTNAQTGTSGTVTNATDNTVQVTRSDGVKTTYVGGQARRFLRRS